MQFREERTPEIIMDSSPLASTMTQRCSFLGLWWGSQKYEYSPSHLTCDHGGWGSNPWYRRSRKHGRESKNGPVHLPTDRSLLGWLWQLWHRNKHDAMTRDIWKSCRKQSLCGTSKSALYSSNRRVRMLSLSWNNSPSCKTFLGLLSWHIACPHLVPSRSNYSQPRSYIHKNGACYMQGPQIRPFSPYFCFIMPPPKCLMNKTTEINCCKKPNFQFYRRHLWMAWVKKKSLGQVMWPLSRSVQWSERMWSTAVCALSHADTSPCC